MSNMFTRLGAGALLALTLGGAAGLSPAPVAAGCYQESCTGQDPSQCAGDAVTYRRRSIRNGWGAEVGVVELRGSNSCGTNWSRVTAYGGSGWRQWVYNSAGAYKESTNRNVQAWSPMIYSRSSPAVACGTVWWTSRFDAGTASACTDPY